MTGQKDIKLHKKKKTLSLATWGNLSNKTKLLVVTDYNPLNKTRIKELISIIDYNLSDEGQGILQENASYQQSEGKPTAEGSY